MLTSKALTDWLTYRGKLRNLGLVAATTLTNQAMIVLRLKEHLGDIELEQLRKSDIEIYVGTRKQTCAAITVWGEVNVLAQALKWCEDEGTLPNKPRIPTVSVPKVEEALPSDDAYSWMVAQLPPAHSRALLLMMLAGLSPHEVERLQVRDRVVDQVGIGQRPDFFVKRQSRRRWVPLNQAAQAVWFEATAGMQPETHPFPTVEAMQTAMRREVDAIAKGPRLAKSELFGHQPPPPGIAQITPKMGRKWFSSKMAQGGVPENVLQRLLGHTPGSPVTRRHYVRSSDAQLAQAVEGLSA